MNIPRVATGTSQGSLAQIAERISIQNEDLGEALSDLCQWLEEQAQEQILTDKGGLAELHRNARAALAGYQLRRSDV